MRLFRNVIVLFLVFSLIEVSYSWIILAGRFAVNRLTLTTTLLKLRGLSLPQGIERVKFFIHKHGKQILMVASIGALLRELENLESGSSEYCYVSSGGNLWCWAYSYGCGCHSAGNNPWQFYSVSCGAIGNSGWDGYVSSVKILKSDGTYVADVPAPGYYRFVAPTDSRIYGEIIVELKNVAPCSGSGADVQEELNRDREVRVRVYPNPADFFRSEVIARSPDLQLLDKLRQEVLNDSSIPWINPEGVFEDLEDFDIRVVGDDSEVLEDVPDNARDIPEDVSISVPELDSSIDIPQRKPFPVELINSFIQSHPILRVLSSISISAGGGSCIVGVSPFVFDFCKWEWVFNLMGAVIVFIASVLPWVGRSE